MSLSKEDMALEALIKLVSNIKSKGMSDQFHSIEYAIEALDANGWEFVEVGAFGRVKAQKKDKR